MWWELSYGATRELYLCFNAKLQIQDVRYALHILDHEAQHALVENYKISVMDCVLDMSVNQKKNENKHELDF